MIPDVGSWTLRSFLVCAGPGLVRFQSLAVLFKILGATGYPCWEIFSSSPFWAGEGTSNVLGISDVLGE